MHSVTLTQSNRAGYLSFLSSNVIYKRLAVALCALVICASAQAESSLPSAPVPAPHVFSAVDWSLAGGIVAGRALDWSSTRQMLRRGYQEEILPSGLAHSKVGLGVFEAGAASIQILSAWELSRHGHRALARTIGAVSLGLSLTVDEHNYGLKSCEGHVFKGMR
jgi:hypothetical protein